MLCGLKHDKSFSVVARDHISLVIMGAYPNKFAMKAHLLAPFQGEPALNMFDASVLEKRECCLMQRLCGSVMPAKEREYSKNLDNSLYRDA